MARAKQLIQVTAILLATWFLGSSSAPAVPAPRSSPAAPPPPAPGTLCIPYERDALLAVKAGLTDPGNYLSSWRPEEDCCSWMGVECSNRTGHVIELKINSYTTTDVPFARGAIGGNISSSLLALRHLRYLDLSWNDFGGKPIPEFIGGLESLTDLVLTSSTFDGRIPPHLGNLSNLTSLHISNQSYSFNSPNLAWVSNLRKLQYLHMSAVDLHAASDWAHAVSMLPSLVTLELRSCGLQNTMAPPLHSNLTSLERISLDSNAFNSSFGAKYLLWDLPNVKYFSMSSCGIVGPIPAAVGNLTSVQSLFLDRNSFTGILPSTFKKLKKLRVLRLSQNFISGHIFSENQIVGSLPTLPKNLAYLDISSNQLVGPIPTLPKNLAYLDLSGNNLSGELPSDIGAPALEILMLFKNSFSGTIPCSLFELQQLQFLDLSDNQLNGTLPNCPRAPKTSKISMLNLNTNNLSGEFPSFLQTCKELKLLDLAYNKFSGSLPTWIGSKLPYLAFLLLRSNVFSGGIPDEITRMKRLQFLDIASNNISGNIPLSLGNLIAMAHTPNEQGALFEVVNFGVFSVYRYIDAYTDSLSVVTKGQQLEYTKGIVYMVNFDLSCNSLTGQIPQEIGKAVALKSLNLSWNNLSGIIPQTIGELRAVESFDLSHNELSGEIPTSLADLTSLAHLNLSYNNLTGTIPSGNQLRILDDQASIYIGNPGLSGPPVSRNCSGTETTPRAPEDQHEGMSDGLSLYVGLGTGFVAGLWIVFCGFLFKRNWRIRCFLFTDRMYDWVYVQVALSWASLTRKNQ